MSYKLIRTRSPFYVQYASTELLVNLDLTVWTGAISSKPGTPSYQLSKEPNGGSATFEVAELIRDYLNHVHLTAGRVWVEVKTYDGVAATVTNTYLATEGYSLYSEGLQHDGTIETVQGIGLPVESINGSTHTYRHLAPETGNTYLPRFNYTAANAGTDSTAAQLVNHVITAVDTVYTHTANGITHTVHIDRLGCSKYENASLEYVNKYGALSVFHFNMKSREMLSTSSDSFLRSLNDFSTLSNNNGLHASRKRITGSKQSFVLNTDFIAEYYTEQLEELFLSEYVWLTYKGEVIPVNLVSNSLDKKTSVNDKLIQYEFAVETASEYINNVR